MDIWSDWEALMCDDCRERGNDYAYDEDGELISMCSECVMTMERSE